MFNKLKPAWAKPVRYMKIYSNGALIGRLEMDLTASVTFPPATQSYIIDRAEDNMMPESITMKETATLRFVRKLVGFHLKTVLQQKWVEVRDPQDNNYQPLIEEWRDVPVEQE